ncbi:gluconokinase [Variovorax soli]|nr:gluconokinase [Variovorax soli]
MAPRILVMGVAGCGKSTVAARLATALGCALIEGDDFHLPQSQHKMRHGIALDDADRWPWLDRLGVLLAEAPGGAVLSCSALKRRYRERLRAAVPALQTVFIDIGPEEARARVAARPAHLFPPSLVASQFEALEPPLGEPGVLRVDAMQPRAVQGEAILRWLGHAAPQPLMETPP